MNILSSRKISLMLAASAAVSLVTSLPAEAGSFRSIDGSGNNITNPTWGETDTELLRLVSPRSEDV